MLSKVVTPPGLECTWRWRDSRRSVNLARYMVACQIAAGTHQHTVVRWRGPGGQTRWRQGHGVYVCVCVCVCGWVGR